MRDWLIYPPEHIFTLFDCPVTLCASFHCILTSGFKVICTLVSAIKSKIRTMPFPWKQTAGTPPPLRICHTGHNEYDMK